MGDGWGSGRNGRSVMGAVVVHIMMEDEWTHDVQAAQ